MSERGSFVTEYVYCKKCFKALGDVLLDKGKFLQSVEIPHWDGGDEPMPIIAGKIGGMHKGAELDIFENQLIPMIEKRICHTTRIAVLGDHGEKIFVIMPDRGKGGLK